MAAKTLSYSMHTDPGALQGAMACRSMHRMSAVLNAPERMFRKEMHQKLSPGHAEVQKPSKRPAVNALRVLIQMTFVAFRWLLVSLCLLFCLPHCQEF